MWCEMKTKNIMKWEEQRSEERKKQITTTQTLANTRTHTKSLHTGTPSHTRTYRWFTKRMYVCCVSICTHEYEQSNHWKLEISHHSNNGAYRQWRLELHSYRDTAKVQLCSHLNGLNRKKPFWTCMCALCVCMAKSVSCRMNNARIRCLYCVFLFMWFTIAHWVWVCSAVTECLSVCVLVE